MPIFPQCAATEEDGPQFSPIMSNHIFPEQLTRLREAGRRMSTLQKLTRETAGFHREAARRHGVNTSRGLAHYKAARAFEAGGQKMMEYFEGGDPGGAPNLNPKAQMEMHQEAVKFHKKQAEKHGLDSDQGHAHITMMEHHMDSARGLKQKSQAQKPQQQQGGVKGRQAPMPVPKKSQMKNPDIRMNKPPIKIRPQQASREAKGTGKNEKYVAQRYDKSHPEGFKKEY